MNTINLIQEAKAYNEAIKLVFIKEYQKVMDDFEMTSKQLYVMQYITQKGKATVNEIADILNSTASAASQQIKKLEEKGYIKRDINKNNRRETFVTLDEKGFQFLEELKRADEAIIEKYFLKLTDKEIQDYHHVMKKLYEMTNSKGE